MKINIANFWIELTCPRGLRSMQLWYFHRRPNSFGWGFTIRLFRAPHLFYSGNPKQTLSH